MIKQNTVREEKITVIVSSLVVQLPLFLLHFCMVSLLETVTLPMQSRDSMLMSLTNDPMTYFDIDTIGEHHHKTINT